MQCRASALAFALATAAFGCGAPDPGGPVEPLVPAAVDTLLHVPSLAALRDGAVGFASGVDGASGALVLLAERYGLDLRSPEALDASGLDARGGLAIFRAPAPGAGPDGASPSDDGAHGATVLAVSVHRPEPFLDRLELRFLRGLGARATEPRPTPGAPRAFAFSGESAPRVAAGVTASGVGLVVLLDPPPDASTPPDADLAAALWRHLAALPRDAALQPPPAPPGGLTLRLPTPDLSPLGAVVGGLGDALGPVGGTVEVLPERLAVAVAAPLADDSGLPMSWLDATHTPPPLASFLPRNTPLFARVAFNADRLRRLPGFLRDRLIPRQVPGLEGAPIPDLPDLVSNLGDEAAVALLGLSPGVPLTALLNVRQLPTRWPRLFRFAFLARTVETPALIRRFELIAAQYGAASDWTVAPIAPPASAPGLRAWTFVRGDTSWAVLIDGDTLIVVSGAAEVDGLLAVRAGDVLPLVASVEDAGAGSLTARSLGLGEAPPTLGVHIGFLRVTRELAERGAPPYFVRALNSLHSVSLGAGVSPGKVELSLEVRL